MGKRIHNTEEKWPISSEKTEQIHREKRVPGETEPLTRSTAGLQVGARPQAGILSASILFFR